MKDALSGSLISMQVGVPRTVMCNGEEVSTGIFKMPVQHRVLMRALNLEGDRQSDLMNHGGRDKAVYAYPSEHYAYWRHELPGIELLWGSFGENLTVAGLFEADVCLGDRFQIGTAEVVVTQPRIP
jgi:MOSC domain-containing protein YiiM